MRDRWCRAGTEVSLVWLLEDDVGGVVWFLDLEERRVGTIDRVRREQPSGAKTGLAAGKGQGCWSRRQAWARR